MDKRKYISIDDKLPDNSDVFHALCRYQGRDGEFLEPVENCWITHDGFVVASDGNSIHTVKHIAYWSKID